VLLRRAPARGLRDHISGYWGYEESTVGRMCRREGPGRAVVVTVSFGSEWLVDDERRQSFVGGLRTSQVTTEHAGLSAGMQIDLVPWAAYRLLRMPMHELAETTVPLDDVLPVRLVDSLADARSWDRRFTLLDEFLTRQLVDAPVAAPEIVWAWQQLRGSHGRKRVGDISDELGWSRKRLVANFRTYLGLPPKAVGRLLRFERARGLSGTMSWSQLAFACGYSDQPHMIADFRSFTGRTPETFLQDDAALGS
jgi:AraC-like DNA-binding protein